jgi:hypothetical protein
MGVPLARDEAIGLRAGQDGVRLVEQTNAEDGAGFAVALHEEGPGIGAHLPGVADER